MGEEECEFDDDCGRGYKQVRVEDVVSLGQLWCGAWSLVARAECVQWYVRTYLVNCHDIHSPGLRDPSAPPCRCATVTSNCRAALQKIENSLSPEIST
jgi:hypothetical protein